MVGRPTKAFSGTWCAFLRDTCGITHTRQPAYQNIQNAQFDAGNMIVFPQTSKFKSYLLSSDVREGTVDVVAKGMAVLWSSLDRQARRSFNEDALKNAYDVNAMRQDFLFLAVGNGIDARLADFHILSRAFPKGWGAFLLRGERSFHWGTSGWRVRWQHYHPVRAPWLTRLADFHVAAPPSREKTGKGFDLDVLVAHKCPKSGATWRIFKILAKCMSYET